MLLDLERDLDTDLDLDLECDLTRRGDLEWLRERDRELRRRLPPWPLLRLPRCDLSSSSSSERLVGEYDGDPRSRLRFTRLVADVERERDRGERLRELLPRPVSALTRM